MRKIDADALFEAMESADWYNNADRDDIAEKLVLDAPTVNQWIPCSERLPEEKINPNTLDYDWVLCSTTFGDVRAYQFGSERFWHGCGDVTQYVIAWQPLPEPYQEDKA